MKNITLSLHEDIVRWARVYAAERDTSVSAFVADMLRERMAREQGYRAAESRFFARKPTSRSAPGDRRASREDLHDRRGLR